MTPCLSPSRLLLGPREWRLWQAARDFARDNLADDLDSRDARGEFSREAWTRCAAFGLTGLPVPAEYGGRGLGYAASVAAFDAFGYAHRDRGLLFSVGAHLWSGVMTIWRFGDSGQRQRYLPGLCGGELIAAHAMTEPDTGSDAFALTTTATPVAGGWILNGRKRFITNAPVADVFVVFAAVPGRSGPFRLLCLLVDTATPGLVVGRPASKAGLRTSPTGTVTFEDCRVGDGALLGTVGMGMAIFDSAIHLERACIMATALGTMQRQIERVAGELSGAGTGTAAPASVGSRAIVAERLGLMMERLHTSRLLAYATARRMDTSRVGAADVSLVKTKVSEAFLANSYAAWRASLTLGGTGAAEAEREIADALAGRIYSGTNEIQRDLIGRGLGL